MDNREHEENEGLTMRIACIIIVGLLGGCAGTRPGNTYDVSGPFVAERITANRVKHLIEKAKKEEDGWKRLSPVNRQLLIETQRYQLVKELKELYDYLEKNWFGEDLE